jgi:hypothetical protein
MAGDRFEILSRRVASSFLNTVVVVDDAAQFRTNESIKPRKLKVPGRQGGVGGAGTANKPLAEGSEAHGLDAKVLIDGFARRGLVCAILRPREQELNGLRDVLSPIAARSDVVILDWVLHEFKQGEQTIEIIRELLKSSAPDRGRARLIIVYSGENNLGQIANTLRSALKLPEPAPTEEALTIERGSARICVYAKEHSRLPKGQQRRRIKAAKLPDIVISEFSNMTRGLVSNVAVSSLAALRANTHQILRRFHKYVDAPFVTHSTLLLPEEAADHLIPLIVSEIQAVLEDSQVSGTARPRHVLQWFAHQLKGAVTLAPPNSVSEKEFRQGLSFLLERGVDSEALKELATNHPNFVTHWLKGRKGAADSVRDRLTETLTAATDKDRVSDKELAMLMSVRSRYATPPPRLTLGSIVLERRRNRLQYLLCIQPRCDSVRLDGDRSFPFVPMRRVADNEKCDFIIDEKGVSVRLCLQDKPFEVRMIRFGPARKADRLVVARRAKDGRFFKASAATRTTYRWVGDLKTEQSQRVAEEFAHKLSRVGLTESEWLRRWMR